MTTELQTEGAREQTQPRYPAFPQFCEILGGMGDGENTLAITKLKPLFPQGRRRTPNFPPHRTVRGQLTKMCSRLKQAALSFMEGQGKRQPDVAAATTSS